MLFLKSLLFIVWNVAWGVLFINLIHWFLFNPRPRFIGKMHIPLTPGFIISKRNWIFNKLRAILHDYLDQADDEMLRNGYLVKWEKYIFETVWEKAQFVEGWKMLPHSWKERIRTFIATLAKDLADKILRQMVPRLIAQLRIERRIDDLDERLSTETLIAFYNRYVHKYLLYAVLAVGFIIGVSNMICFLIIA